MTYASAACPILTGLGSSRQRPRTADARQDGHQQPQTVGMEQCVLCGATDATATREHVRTIAAATALQRSFHRLA